MDPMKKSFGGESRNRWISVLLLSALIPLWIVGWILFFVGSKNEISPKIIQKDKLFRNKFIADKTENELIEQSAIA